MLQTKRRAARSGPYQTGDDPILQRYFSEVSTVKRHQAEDEFRLGRALREAEVAHWSELLRYRPLREPTLRRVQLALEEGVGREASLTLLDALRGSDDDALARGLRDLDDGQRLLRRALDELEAAVADRRRLPGLARHRRSVRALGLRARQLRDEFVRSHLRLVVTVAKSMKNPRLPLPDLIQEGNLGLIRAVERYDYRRGFRFSTYACWWIRHSILRAIADRERFVRLPIHLIEAGRRADAARRSLAASLGRPATDDEIAASTGTSLENVQRMRLHLSQSIYSLEQPLDEGRPLEEAIQDPEALVPMEKVEERSLQAEAMRKLSQLRPIEREVLCSRFGFSEEAQTLSEIGSRYQLSRERIRQIQNEALGKIRRYLQRSRAV